MGDNQDPSLEVSEIVQRHGHSEHIIVILPLLPVTAHSAYHSEPCFSLSPIPSSLPLLSLSLSPLSISGAHSISVYEELLQVLQSYKQFHCVNTL